MRVLLFGATGMLGQGMLRECLLDPKVTAVLSVGRNAAAQTDAKLRQITLPSLTQYTDIEPELNGWDACFFCLGVSSAGMQEQQYREITFDIALAAAGTLARLNADMTFVYVSGAGTDSSEKGRVMWARVKGATENALLRLPFKGCFMFRPGFIQPLHGIQSKTPVYRAIYAITKPFSPLLLRLFPRSITTTEQLGRAMLSVARHGFSKPILEASDICRF